jgi:hypothetical protein
MPAEGDAGRQISVASKFELPAEQIRRGEKDLVAVPSLA